WKFGKLCRRWILQQRRHRELSQYDHLRQFFRCGRRNLFSLWHDERRQQQPIRSQRPLECSSVCKFHSKRWRHHGYQRRHDPDGDSNIVEPLPVDQRGSPFARISAGTVDIGAFESQAEVTLDGTTGDDEITVSLGATYVVTINGADTTLSPDDFSKIIINGL